MPTSFGDKDFVTEYKKCIPDMEPWIENTYTPDTEPWTRGFLNNDKKFLLIIGQKSIQLWKSKSQNFKDSEDFKRKLDLNKLKLNDLKLDNSKSALKFKILELTLKLDQVHLPVTRLIEAKSASFLQYEVIRNEELSNIYIVPFLFKETTHDSKDEDKRIIRIIKKSFRLLLRLLLLRGYSYKESSQFFSFLQKNQHKGNREYFNAPIVEAFITSKWLQARNHWGIRLMFYTTFLFLFSFLSQLFLSDNDYQNKHNATFMTVVGIFYYVGTYLLIIEFMQIYSIVLGISVFTLIFVKSFNETSGINHKYIVVLLTVTTLILWTEMIMPFFVFMVILTIGFGHSIIQFKFVLLGHPSLLDLIPSAPTYTLDNGTTNFTLTGEIPENPFNTIWDAILSAYYWNTIDFSDYDYWPLKLFAFIANVILVLVLLNMIIALMNDAFTKAKEDGTDGLLLFRTDLIHDYESTPYNKYRDISENDIWFLMKESTAPYNENQDISEDDLWF
uniref:Ion transport domain-containing protein n=1 Tax=Rhizophagus irregularis (strain DAOM 181602 / DAOM 197198 / MUCL 43194) TaxID=747089 RepID=U9TLM1_RHIID